MTAFAQREHFLERPMFLTAPPVGRFAVQNSQRFHYYGELRVNLDSFKVNGADTGFQVADPRFACFMRCVNALNLARQVDRIWFFPAMYSVSRPSAVFQARGPADRGMLPLVWYNGGRAARIDAGRVWREFTRPRQARQALLWTRQCNETATINAAFIAETFRIKL